MMDAFKTQDIDHLKKEMDELESVLADIGEDRKRIEAQLECFDASGAFETFREKVLIPELGRLAHLRMTMDSKDRELHDRVLGQYNEVKLLASKKAELENELKFNVARKAEISDRLGIITKRYNKRVKRTHHGG